MSGKVDKYAIVPIQLWRMGFAKKQVQVRPYVPGSNNPGDVVLHVQSPYNDIVRPSPDDVRNYQAPYGISMRGLDEKQKNIAKTFGGNNVILTKIPAGTALPNDLVLVKENNGHWSLQPKVQMTKKELESKLEAFISSKGEAIDRLKWLQKYGGLVPQMDKGPKGERLKWSWQRLCFYYNDSESGNFVVVQTSSKQATSK